MTIKIDIGRLLRALRHEMPLLLPEYLHETVVKALWDAGANETDLSLVFVVNREHNGGKQKAISSETGQGQ
jgi:hypothetical protein